MAFFDTAIKGGQVAATQQTGKSADDIMAKLNNVRVEFGPSGKDILNFTTQLSVMVRAGIALPDALESIASQIEKEKFRVVVADIKERIEAGQSFSQALGEHTKVFSSLYINMIAAAEVSGSLGSMLDKLAGYLDQEAETKSQVKAAMVYPIIIATMAIGSTIFLLTFVLPRFTSIFAGKEHLLPGPTKVILALSDFLRGYWYFLIPVVCAGIWGLWFYINTKQGREVWDKLKLKIPLMSKLCSSLYITRGLHTMGVLFNAGVPILDILNITAQISGNIHYKKLWLRVHDNVRQGKKIADTLGESELMPKSVSQMLRSGEESGTMSEVLEDVSDFYSRELKTTIKMVTSMIEPIMIVVMGVLVGFIAMSVILPIFKMSSLVSGK